VKRLPGGAFKPGYFPESPSPLLISNVPMDQVTLDALATFPQTLERLYAAVPADYTHWTPPSWDGIPSETFTAIEQICHVRDIELDGYRIRFHRALTETNPTLDSLDSYQLARQRNYASANAADVLLDVRIARATTIQLLRTLTPEQFARPALFEGYGPLTVRGLAHYLCSHDQQHLAGLQWLLGQIDASAHNSAV
jgi:DinB superfamily